MSTHIISQLRIDYSSRTFDEKDAVRNPFLQFEVWMNEALQSEVIEPNAFVLSTVDDQNHPSSRISATASVPLVVITSYRKRPACGSLLSLLSVVGVPAN
jgi:pyridoxine/pyridoxamine 5'-phosphate oxidase